MVLDLKGMRVGVATAATQIEGGDVSGNWNDWFDKGHIKDGSDPARADDHYARFEDDLRLMRDLGIRDYRFGIEWARVNPQRGRFDEDAVAHYAALVERMHSYGIRPLLTLHHFSNPMWIEAAGSWENPETVTHFLAFVKVMLDAVGGYVSEYITINEPNVYATNGFFYGIWPPGKRAYAHVKAVFSNLTLAHIECYKYIHAYRKSKGFTDTRVSFANHLRVFDPVRRFHPVHRFFARLSEKLFQGDITRAMMRGVMRFPLGRNKQIKKGRYYDFIAVNYYSRSMVRRLGDGVRAGAPVNDLGWEIYPEGLTRLIERFYRKYDAPVYVTESGTCDNTDAFRSRYIFEHLQAACRSNAKVERFYHWTFMDNFEWLEGESARFGIVHVDYETQTRTVKRSGELLSAIIRDGGVTQDTYDTYIRGQEYRSVVTQGD